jgi:hypothetical protein
MAILASAVMALAAAQLNDANQSTYVNAVLLPHLKNAFKRLSSEFNVHDLKYTEEVSADLSVGIGVVALVYGGSPALPADLIQPIQLWEKASGASTTLYEPMDEVEVLSIRDQDDELLEWNWREGEIKFVGATTVRDVRILYEKLMAQVSTENTSIALIDVDLFLSSQTAAYAALIVGGNRELAQFNQAIADDELGKIIRNRVKKRQAQPTRRLPYGYYRRNRRR